MIFIVLAIIAGLICGWFIIKPKDGFSDYFFGVFFSLFFGVVGFVAGLILCFVAGCFIPQTYVPTGNIELVAMQDNNGIRGNFYLGSGQVRSEFRYVFYAKNGEGIVFNSVPANDAIIFEQDRKGGVIKVYEKKFIDNSYYLIGVSGGQRYEIFVPKGSVKSGFDFDLK